MDCYFSGQISTHQNVARDFQVPGDNVGNEVNSTAFGNIESL